MRMLIVKDVDNDGYDSGGDNGNDNIDDAVTVPMMMMMMIKMMIKKILSIFMETTFKTHYHWWRWFKDVYAGYHHHDQMNCQV